MSFEIKLKLALVHPGYCIHSLFKGICGKNSYWVGLGLVALFKKKKKKKLILNRHLEKCDAEEHVLSLNLNFKSLNM